MKTKIRSFSPKILIFLIPMLLYLPASIFLFNPFQNKYSIHFNQSINKINFLIPSQNSNKSIIYMTMSTNAKGVLPTIITISSLMENSRKFFYEFYIIVENHTNPEYQKIKSLEKLYNRLKINFIEHPTQIDEMSDIIKDGYWPKPAWYRLWLTELLPHIDRIIHVDCDCYITDDLDEMYNMNMTDLNIRGVIDPSPHNSKIIRNDKYMCSGVLLMNLKRMRENNMTKKYVDIILKYNTKLSFPDQIIINSVDIENNDLLPLKYGILYVGVSPNSYYHMIRVKNRFTLNDFQDAFDHPIIAHIVWKPFIFFVKHPIYIRWWETAMITCFHEEIKQKYEFYSKYKNLLNHTYIKENRKKSCSF